MKKVKNMNDIMEKSRFDLELVKMSEDVRFVGINREDESKFRPGYIMEFIPEGQEVCVPVNDGFYTMEANEPYFVARSCYSTRSITFPLSQLNNAMKSSGFEFELKSIPTMPVENDDGILYKKSKLTGLCKFQPMIGGGKICKSCGHKASDNGCNLKNSPILERFNDGVEYCHRVKTKKGV